MIDLLYILAFTVLFSIFDYIGYNEFNKKGWTNGIIAPYRIVQTSFQIILIGLAFYFFGWKVAVGFVLLWWTWVCDFIFHLFCYGDFYNDRQYVTKNQRCVKYIMTEKQYKEYLEKYFDEQENEWKCVLYWNEIKWAWWTPYGLVDLAINGMPFQQFRVIRWQALAFQSFIGILAVILIVIICQSV